MQKGRGLLELIFVVLIVGIIAGVFAVSLARNLDEARTCAMGNQLTNLRKSLELYMMLEGRYPEDFKGLNKRQKVLLGEDSLYGRRYLEFQIQDEEGYPVDPYGRRFIYNNKTGKIERSIK